MHKFAKFAKFAAVLLILVLVRCSVIRGMTSVARAQSQVLSGPRSLCNTFGGCGTARSISGGAGVASYQHEPRQRSNFRFVSRTSARSAARPSVSEQAAERPLDIAMHPARVGRYVQDQVQLDRVGRGIRTKHNPEI